MAIVSNLHSRSSRTPKRRVKSSTEQIAKKTVKKPLVPSDRLDVEGLPSRQVIQKDSAPKQARIILDKPAASTVETEEVVSDQETNWVLASVDSTDYANDPSVAIVKKRFGTLNKIVRSSLTTPLLEAITTAEFAQGSEKLKDLADTANWAQKFKKDALRLAEEGGFESMLEAAKAELERQNTTGSTPLDRVLQSESLLFGSELNPSRTKEANLLIERFESGNTNPGIGSKALGKGISYLRGRKGTRIFFKPQDDNIQWLAVCDKSTEPKAIKLLQKEFGLK